MFKKMMTSIVATVVVAVTAAAGTAEELQKKLDAAIATGDSAAATQWATALNQFNSAELAAEQKKATKTANSVFAVYGNAIKSAPAILSGVELMNSLQKEPDSEVTDIVAAGRTLLKLVDRPLKYEEDVKPLVKQLDASEKQRQAKWKEREEKWRKDHNR